MNSIKTILLYPLAVLYDIVTSVRNFFFDTGILKSKQFKISTISVGNITVGGTGKTPHTELLVRLLKDKYKTAVLSRGYKRLTKGFFIADNHEKTSKIGDESKQIKDKFPDITVAVCEKRTLGVEEICTGKKDTEVIILDDAFQHRYINPGLSILLVDYNRPIFEDKIMPAGQLRESSKQIKRADVIIVSKVPPKIKPIELNLFEKKLKISQLQKIFFSTMKYSDFKPVFIRNFMLIDKEICKNANYYVLLFTGIANSTPLKNHILKFTKNLTELNFADHHNYDISTIQEIENKFNSLEAENKILLTTEKDAVKLREIENIKTNIKEKMFYIEIEPEILNNKQEEFNKLIISYVRKNKTNNRIFAR